MTNDDSATTRHSSHRGAVRPAAATLGAAAMLVLSFGPSALALQPSSSFSAAGQNQISVSTTTTTTHTSSSSERDREDS